MIRRPPASTLTGTLLPFSSVVRSECVSFGLVLMLDGVLQTTERDEFIYHEMLAHLPILAHGAARKVLLVGGGDGGLLEEVLKHPGVEQVTQVEIDAGVIERSEEHTSELQSLMRISYAVFCLKKKK